MGNNVWIQPNTEVILQPRLSFREVDAVHSASAVALPAKKSINRATNYERGLVTMARASPALPSHVIDRSISTTTAELFVRNVAPSRGDVIEKWRGILSLSSWCRCNIR